MNNSYKPRRACVPHETCVMPVCSRDISSRADTEAHVDIPCGFCCSSRVHDSRLDAVSNLSILESVRLHSCFEPKLLHPRTKLLCSWSQTVSNLSQRGDVYKVTNKAQAQARFLDHWIAVAGCHLYPLSLVQQVVPNRSNPNRRLSCIAKIVASMAFGNSDWTGYAEHAWRVFLAYLPFTCQVLLSGILHS
ncbi:hypothetical protein Mapa_006647 [Marchantia paleacea]|nr:hypothetical protein Mapa_006647 [Marchantia paleacea]